MGQTSTTVGGSFAELEGFNGLKLGSTQTASGSHSGLPGCTNGVGGCNNPGENPGIDQPWQFFGNTGMDFTTVATNVSVTSPNTATVNFSGWTVTWNGIPAISMGSGAWEAGYTSGQAKVTCQSTCADGENYTLEYLATVPANSPNFAGVSYHLHLEGKVVTGTKAADDTAKTTVGQPVDINVLTNDAAVAGIDVTSVAPSSPNSTQGGTVLANTTTGVVTYNPPGAGFYGTDTFKYTYKDLNGVTSNEATVTVTVNINTPPAAVNDTLSVTAGTSQTIIVLANDTDLDNNIDPTTVDTTAVGLMKAQHGTVSVDATTGAITYHASSFVGTETFQYTVNDTAGATSNPATVIVTINAFSGDWKNPLNPGDVPILAIESGSYFTMQMAKDPSGGPVYTTTNLDAGADGGLILGAEQFAGGSHTGKISGNEVTGIDQAWEFFGNTGMHFTANGGIGVNDSDGTLDFNNKWFVTWNKIPAINMGGSSQDDAAIRGKASIACSSLGGTNNGCIDGSGYVLTYSATVPAGDPSGFGGVPYGLHLVGHVHFLNKALVSSSGSIGPGSHGGSSGRVTATDLINAGIPADTAVATQCVGDCFDFQVATISGARVQVVLPLRFGIRPNSTYRKYTAANGWHDFDTSSGDTVKSAPLTYTGATPTSAVCPPANDPSYTPGLTAGNRCVQLDIADNGPNDANGAVGTVSDPSGVAAAAVVEPPDTRTTSSSGCSLSAGPVNPLERGDWWLLLGLVAWMGFVIRRKRA
jgi:hypothetical protein